MADKPKYFYRDIVTDKICWTRARFAGWHGPDGLLNAYYAMFQRPAGTMLFVPEYLLTKETLQLLDDKPHTPIPLTILLSS